LVSFFAIGDNSSRILGGKTDSRRLRADFVESFFTRQPTPEDRKDESCRQGVKPVGTEPQSRLRETLFLEGWEIGEQDWRGRTEKTMMLHQCGHKRNQPDRL
jgi:hypothetical protein